MSRKKFELKSLKKHLWSIGLLLPALVPIESIADTSATDLARASQNPLSNMISLPFQNNTNFNVGPDNETQNVLNIQPVYPISLNDDWNLITRTIIPVISQPATLPHQNRTNGIGDIQFTAWASPKLPTDNGWIWGVGLVTQLDSATKPELGEGVWGLGPTAVVLKSEGPWVFGGLINNIWSIGDKGDTDVNKLLMQPFINYNFPDKPGRYFSFAPIVTANWEADEGEKWNVPLGFGIGQVTKWGEQPINVSAQAYYNVVKPEYGADWQLRLQIQFLFPK